MGVSYLSVRKGDAKYKALPPCPHSKLQEKHHGNVLQAAVGVGGLGGGRAGGATQQMTLVRTSHTILGIPHFPPVFLLVSLAGIRFSCKCYLERVKSEKVKRVF